MMVDRMREVWPAIKDTLPLANDLWETITEHMARVPLFTGERALASVVNGQRREVKAAGVPTTPRPETALQNRGR
jgi:hypothetical protein